MSWIYLLAAGVLEMGWPVGLKLAHEPKTRLIGIFMAVALMALSGFFLWLAQRAIALGTAYAVWTGIGAAGTFILGVTLFGDVASAAKVLGIFLIIAGVATLKLAS